MVSQCKVCGARTAGHRQYCPDCRHSGYGPGKARNRITGIGSMKMPDNKTTRGISVFIVNLIVSIPILIFTILLMSILTVSYIFKTLYLVIRKIIKKDNKIFTIGVFERGILSFTKKIWVNSFDFMKRNAKKEMERPYEQPNNRRPRSYASPITYRRKLSDNLRSYGGN